jgi:hypothetical protein
MKPPFVVGSPCSRPFRRRPDRLRGAPEGTLDGERLAAPGASRPKAFARFLAPDAVFVDNPVNRGPDASSPPGGLSTAQAPFSWAPETIAVLDTGKLA